MTILSENIAKSRRNEITFSEIIAKSGQKIAIFFGNIAMFCEIELNLPAGADGSLNRTNNERFRLSLLSPPNYSFTIRSKWPAPLN